MAFILIRNPVKIQKEIDILNANQFIGRELKETGEKG